LSLTNSVDYKRFFPYYQVMTGYDNSEVVRSLCNLFATYLEREMKFVFKDRSLGGKGAIPPKYLPEGGKAQVDHWDDGDDGLGLRVTKGGKRTFFIWYRFNGKARRDTLKKVYPSLSLREARAEAGLTKDDIADGRDPRLSSRAPRAHYAPKSKDIPDIPGTYAKAVGEYVRRYQEGKAQNKTAGEVKRALLKFGEDWEGVPISEISARDIRAKLEAVRDAGKGYMANRLHSYASTFFSWCAEPGIEIVETSPMWGLKKPWDGEASRNRVFNDDEIAAIWTAADQLGDVHKAYVKILILTGKRKNAAAAMRWSEIDETGLWEPPQDLRQKRGNKRLHAIPLPPLAHRIIKALPKVKGNDFVFTGKKDGQHIDPGTNLKRSIQKFSGVEDFFYHALRHTMETRLAQLRVPPHIRDIVLDHAPDRGAGAGYDHHAYRDEMSEALEAWADHVQGVLVAKGIWQENVEPIRG
jgi:integrase